MDKEIVLTYNRLKELEAELEYLKTEKRNSFVSRQDNVSHYSLSPIEFLFFYFNCIVRTYFCKRERRNMPTKRPNV